jgi:RNA polymerase sigma-70 factor (ECF subfamily)
MRSRAVTDAELVSTARAGDSASLGLLLERHRAALYAAAVALLGSAERAQDAVQETSLVAMRRLPELRDPAAFGPWLRVIGRHVCLMERRRGYRELLVDDPVDERGLLAEAEKELERHILRAWLWGAIDELPEGQRVAVMLRYFGRECSYEEIAEICAVPVGTVRSRLNAARHALAERLLAEATPDARVAERTDAWRSRFSDAIDALNRGDSAPARTLLATDAVITAGDRIGGPRDVLPALLADSDAGVRVHVGPVVAGSGVVVLDGTLENPPDDPSHCPPAYTWVGVHDGSRIERLRFHHPARVATVVAAEESR